MKTTLALITLAFYSMTLAAKPCTPPPTTCDNNWGANGYPACQAYSVDSEYCENACKNKETPWVKAHPKETSLACTTQCNSDCECCD